MIYIQYIHFNGLFSIYKYIYLMVSCGVYFIFI